MNLSVIYEKDIPDFLREAAVSAPMRRLKSVGMHCGCEYTSFPTYAGLESYTRFDHSLGVGLIVWHFTENKAQALAGLLHDVATPAFAHVIDFLRGDHMTQESTESGTTQIIDRSGELQEILARHGLTTYDVCDYHRYPIADNDSPKLSADRLEYTLGNLVNFGFCTKDEIKSFYDDLTVGINEYQQEEIMFQTPSVALDFAKGALKCSHIYVSDADRFTMQALADLLKEALQDEVLAEQDFYLTEPELIQKLTGNEVYAEKWRRYCSYKELRTAARPDFSGKWLRVSAKKRYIDPFIQGCGRVSRVYPEHSEKIEAFKAASQDIWLCGQ